MANVRITEFGSAMVGPWGATQVPLAPALTHQTVTIGTEAKSSAFNQSTHLIRVQAEDICCIEIGSAPTATTDMVRMVAGQTEYFGVNPGDKLSAITST